MDKALLDTDMLSEIFKSKNQIVSQNAAAYLNEHQRFTLTNVTVYEVLYGLRIKGATRQIEDFAAAAGQLEILSPSLQDYRIAAEIRAALHLAGTPIGALDPIIAACALNRDLPLVTGNSRHYGFVQNAGFLLQLIDWRQNIV